MVCSKMVDLPIPGSPPISTTEPSTSPPPSTRSSSFDWVLKRGISSTLTSARVLSWACSPAQPVRLPLREAPSTTVSTMVFQAPQSVHCPAHLGWVAPHSVQPKIRLALAISAPCLLDQSDEVYSSHAGAERHTPHGIAGLARRSA